MASIQFPHKVLREAKALAAQIVDEIVQKMKDTLASKGKSFSPGALDEWRPKLQKAVFANILNGGNWTNDRATVLSVAKDMAKIGALLASTSPTVNKARVHASFRAVKEHAKCPGNPGSGRWCDFDI